MRFSLSPDSRYLFHRILLLIPLFLLFSLPLHAKEEKAPAGADVAVYNDAKAPLGMKGVWNDDVTAVAHMLSSFGLSSQEIGFDELNDPKFPLSGVYKMLVVPGGWAAWYNYWIGKDGKEKIREFVRQGGGYVGICAGAFFATDKIVWAGAEYDDKAGYNAYFQMTGYDLDLFPGTATGPIAAIADWYTKPKDMTQIEISPGRKALAGYPEKELGEIHLYWGGPYFEYVPDGSETVEARYAVNGKPAIVSREFGKGRLVLIGTHPEIEENSDRDGIKDHFKDGLDDRGSDWDLMKYLVNWVLPTTEPKEETASSSPAQTSLDNPNP